MAVPLATLAPWYVIRRDRSFQSLWNVLCSLHLRHDCEMVSKRPTVFGFFYIIMFLTDLSGHLCPKCGNRLAVWIVG